MLILNAVFVRVSQNINNMKTNNIIGETAGYLENHETENGFNKLH